jgi:hypothetical protein
MASVANSTESAVDVESLTKGSYRDIEEVGRAMAISK